MLEAEPGARIEDLSSPPVPPIATERVLRRKSKQSLGQSIMNMDGKIFYPLAAAGGALIHITGDVLALQEHTPIPLAISVSFLGAAVTLMSIRLYLEDKIDRIQNFRQNHRKSSSITS